MSPSAPRFVVLQRIATGSVVGLGLVSLWLGGELPPATAVFVLAALLWRVVRGAPPFSARTWVMVQLSFLIWLGLGWALLGKHVLTVFSQLLLFVQLHRVLTRRGARDDVYSYFIAFGMVLLASVLTFSPAWFITFLAFLVCFVWAMLLSRLALATESAWHALHPDTPVADARWRALDPLVRAPVFAAVAALNLLLLGGTVGLFFLLPRMQVSFLTGSLLPPVHVSGFSDRVRLGEIGLLQLSREPVMRVKAWGPDGAPVPAENLYWHGLALDRFDGRDWTLSDERKQGLVALGRRAGPPRELPWVFRLEVSLEPLDSRVLFFVPQAAGIYGEFTTLEAVSTEGYYMTTPRRRESYVVYSNPGHPDPDLLRTQDPRAGDPEILTRYTQLPSTLSPRIAALTEAWVSGAATPLDEVLLVQDRLKNEFTYSLDQPASAAPDPLVSFLYDVQEGHCEYFATAMALMLRTRGLPARIVNGFAGAEWNPVGEYWLVRQDHAHSWVEVWFPASGWVVFDPTPSAGGGLEASAQRGLRARLADWADYGQLLWSDVMLDYDLGNQAEGFQALIRRLASFSEGASVPVSDGPAAVEPTSPDEGSPFRWVLLALGLLAAAFAARRRGPWSPDIAPAGRAIDRLHRRLQKAAEGHADGPDRFAPPLAFARWAARQDEDRFGDAPAVVQAWYAARYGGGELPPDLARRGRRLARAARHLSAGPPATPGSR
jgi:protein-glutamine gamma-glutamyltransferase